MVLTLDGRRQTIAPSSESELEKLSPRLRQVSERLRNAPCERVGPHRLLYVGQREFAVVSPADEKVDVIGSEDATTCHLLVLRHSGSGVTCLSHLDGLDTAEGIRRMVDKTRALSGGYPDGRLELHLVGGFIDDNLESNKITAEVLNVVQSLPEEVHLLTACVCSANDVVIEKVHFPVVYGVAVDIKHGRLFKASFFDKGPDIPLRSARHFVGSSRRRLLDIYDSDHGRIVVDAFSFERWDEAALWLRQPDDVLLSCMSTSPAQERPDFVANLRLAIGYVVDHPKLSGIFPGNRRVYERGPDGLWRLANPILADVRS